MELNVKAKSAYSVQSYRKAPAIQGVEVVQLQRFHDDGGSITELGRLTAGHHGQLTGFECKQVNYSEIEPSVIKAYHLHRRQTDVWYVPPCDRLLVVLHDCRAASPTEGQTMRLMLGDGQSRLLRIPPGVAHGCRNLGAATARIIYMVDVQFTPDEGCDEGRLPWNHLGADLWDPVKG